MGCPVDVEEATTTSKASIAKCTIARECLSLNFSAQFVEIGIGPLGEYSSAIESIRRWDSGSANCSAIARLCCASAPMLRVAKKRYHAPLVLRIAYADVLRQARLSNIRPSIGTENPIPEKMDYRKITVRVPVMNKVQLLFASEPCKLLKPRSL
jgi:hypothetical protein